jgi:hypothetical protein
MKKSRCPLHSAFVAPDRSWVVVRDSDGFRVRFFESLVGRWYYERFVISGWRDSGFGVFPSCAAAVAFVASL